VGSLEEIIAFNEKDLANRAPYGQDHLEASENTAITAEEYAALKQNNQETARNSIDQLLTQYDIDVIVSAVSQAYAPAGYPALTVPIGYAADGTPRDTVFVGGFLSEPQLLAVGYAFEQGGNARAAPDLETTMQLIKAMPVAGSP
jgi:amidase